MNISRRNPLQLSVVARRFSSAVSPENSKNESNQETLRPQRILAEPNKRPPGFVPAPYTRTTFGAQKKSLNMVHDEFPNEGDITGIGARLKDYYWIQDYVRQLKTPQERIDFVNPYQRPWTRFEKKWHRVFHPVLTAPRKAWIVPPVPNYFDCLEFYKYITKTRLVEESQVMDGYYSGLVPPTSKFERRLEESLKIFFQGEDPKDSASVTNFLRAIFDDAQMSIAHNVDWVKDYRQSTNERCESFWIRGGFLGMYEKLEIWDEDGFVDTARGGKPRFIGDDKRKLGELAFAMRDKLSVQLRARTGLPEVVSWSNSDVIEAPLFPPNVDAKKDVIYSPTQFNFDKDAKPLWICPGYEPDCNEPFMFGRLAVKSVVHLNYKLQRWNPAEDEERDTMIRECLSATAISSLFNWLNGQAHCLGYTQYNDIEAPLISQMILSDGKRFLFALGQLNTIAINIEMDGFINRKSNLCLVDGPYNLYDEIDKETGNFKYEDENGELVDGLNPKVLTRFLQMLMIGRQK